MTPGTNLPAPMLNNYAENKNTVAPPRSNHIPMGNSMPMLM